MVLQLTSCPFRTAVLMPNLKYIVSHESYPFRGQKSEAVRNKQWQDTTPQLQEPKCKQRRPAVFFVRISFYIGRFLVFFFFFWFFSLLLFFILIWSSLLLLWYIGRTVLCDFCVSCLFVCVEVLRPSQPNGITSSAVSLPNHTFTGQVSPLSG